MNFDSKIRVWVLKGCEMTICLPPRAGVEKDNASSSPIPSEPRNRQLTKLEYLIFKRRDGSNVQKVHRNRRARSQKHDIIHFVSKYHSVRLQSFQDLRNDLQRQSVLLAVARLPALYAN